MITITILMQEPLQAADEIAPTRWLCWLSLSDGKVTWHLPVTAPGDLTTADLQKHFESQADYLWQIACEKCHAPDIYAHLPAAMLVKALASHLQVDDAQMKEALSSALTAR